MESRDGGGKMESRDGGGKGRGEVGEIQAFFITTLSLSSVNTQGSLSSRPLCVGGCMRLDRLLGPCDHATRCGILGDIRFTKLL